MSFLVLARRSDAFISRYSEEEQRSQRRKGPGIYRQDERIGPLDALEGAVDIRGGIEEVRGESQMASPECDVDLSLP